MRRHRIKRLPVVTSSGTLIGIVARRDLLSWYLEPDSEIRAAIVRDVLERALGIGDTRVEVHVRNGLVTLSGIVDSALAAHDAVELSRGVPGAVDVVADLEVPRRTRPGPPLSARSPVP